MSDQRSNLSMKKSPKIFVGIITYNQAKYLPSLFEGLLQQDYKNLHISISNDCSSDNSDEVIKEYCFKLSKEFPEVNYNNHTHNLGGQGRGNITYLSSQIPADCDYVTILEGDDFYHSSSKFSKQLEKIGDNGAIHSDVRALYENGNIEEAFWKKYRIHQTGNDPKIPTGNIFNHLLRCNFVYTCALLVKKDLYLKAYDYNLFTKLGIFLGDYAGVLRLAKLTNIEYIDESLSTYRVISSSSSHQNRDKVVQDTAKLQQLAINGALFEGL